MITTDPGGQTQQSITERLGRADLGRWLGQVQQVRSCARPVRLVGHTTTIDTATGEIMASYNSAGEPDGITYLRCGNRRAAVCPSCSHEYKGDVWHVLMAGAAGGMKDVPATIANHPLVFATLTAPSFGAVHAAKKPGRPGSRRCQPRGGEARRLCPHGRPRWCMTIHDHADPEAGQPLCGDCYDYTGHLVWQWWAPELWRRFTITLRRRLAQHLGLTETAARRLVRVQFAKVAEFQRRGLVHFHALIRLDGPATDLDPYPPPAAAVDSTVLAELVRTSAAAVSYTAPPVAGEDQARPLRFGAQLDARPVNAAASHDGYGAELHPETVAAYIAKYATKAAGDLAPGPNGGNPHLHRLRDTLTRLARHAMIAGLADPDHPYHGWGRWGDTLGFRGHFATKSRRYSITLGRLRQARRDHVRRRPDPHTPGRAAADSADVDQADDESTLIIGHWRFAGIGWLTSGDAALAAAAAARARNH